MKHSIPLAAAGTALSLALLTSCGTAAPTASEAPAPASTPGGAPDLSLPTYSQVVSTYPAGTVLNGTVATATNVKANGVLTFAGGSLANGCGAVLSKYGPMVCYGSKLTIGDTSVTIDGTTYPPGTKLTTDKDLKLLQVSSWD